MGRKVAAAALQYSKWLSKFICWTWAIYRFTVIILAAIVPAAAEALVSTIAGLDTIMLVNEGTYLVNSLGEKYIYSDRAVLKWLDKGGFKYLFSRLNKSIKQEEEETEQGEEVEEDGDNLNG